MLHASAAAAVGGTFPFIINENYVNWRFFLFVQVFLKMLLEENCSLNLTKVVTLIVDIMQMNFMKGNFEKTSLGNYKIIKKNFMNFRDEGKYNY